MSNEGNEKNNLGIEYNIFDYSRGRKSKIMGFRAAPGNVETGLSLMRKKLGITSSDADKIKDAAKKNRHDVIHSSVLKRR